MDDAKARRAEMWGSAAWEHVAETMAPIHDRLVASLNPRPGERWLDVGTGTGAVAVRAARAGAAVMALDLSPVLLATARHLASEAGLSIQFDVGDVEQLPYDDASFDVVVSAHGVVFAPDHAAAARELARVCRRGGRLGLTAWRRGGDGEAFHRIVAKYSPPSQGPAGADWGREAHARELLGDAFDLDFVPDVWMQTGESGEAIWQLITTHSPPFRDLVESLDPGQRESLHREWVDYYESCRRDGVIHAPNEYMVILGTRRAA